MGRRRSAWGAWAAGLAALGQEAFVGRHLPGRAVIPQRRRCRTCTLSQDELWGSWNANISAYGADAPRGFAEMAIIQEIFERWDRDGSGELSLEEFRDGLRREGSALIAARPTSSRPSFRESLLEPIGGFFHHTWHSVSSGVSAAGAGLAGYSTGFWDAAVHRVTCWSNGCRVAWNDGARFVGSAPGAVGQAILNGEGRFVYNLFSRQLAVFVPDFWDSTHIEADIFLQRSFWLRNLSVSPAAASLLIALAPPGLNFTKFWISDVKVSWNNLMALDSSPIVVEIDSVWAEVAEQPAGSEEEVEDLISRWLDVVGGVQPDPFQGKYPLLDAATFRVRHVDLLIDSPTRYGQVDVSLRGLEAKAVNNEGRQEDLMTMLEDGKNGRAGSVSMSRLVECSQASARYRWPPGHVSNDFSADYLLEPTPLSLLLRQIKNVSDLRQILHQCYTVTLPSGAMFLRAPFGEDAPPIPPPDPRLSPFEGPTPEWRIHVASHDQSDWIFSAWMSQPAAKTVAVAGMGIGMVVFTFFLLCVASNCFIAVRPRPWLRRFLWRMTSLNLLPWL
ncbi:unnamed protein product [Symbiodinium sp. CCMP2592]|nr:unnamed protein product [Symbiodinium sp. CCMP2592]